MARLQRPVPPAVPSRRPAASRGSASAPTTRAARTQRAVEEPNAPERWLANIRLSSFTIVIMALIVLGVIVLAPSLKLLIGEQAQIAELQKSVNQQKQKVAGLKGQVARWDDPAYIEAQARNRLLFVFPGEYSYLVIPTKTTATTQGGAPISKRIQTTKIDWVKALSASIFSAGLSDQAAANLDDDTGSIVSPTQTGTTAGGQG